MTMAGLPLVEQLPPPNGSAIVLLGGDETLARGLRRAGYQIDRHALDTGPLAQTAEHRSGFVPPVVEWPRPRVAIAAPNARRAKAPVAHRQTIRSRRRASRAPGSVAGEASAHPPGDSDDGTRHQPLPGDCVRDG